MDDWLQDTKNGILENRSKASKQSVSDLVRVLGRYRCLEEKLVDLLVELQASNKVLEDIIVEKKSISVTG